MTLTLVTGGTGTLGSELRPTLLDEGFTVRATSRSPPDNATVEWVPMDLEEGLGIEAAVEDVEAVIHTASAPRGDSETIDVAGTKRLLDAAQAANVDHFIYVSIVGIEDIPYSYYEHKLAAEEAVEASPVPSTIVRATQFHSFIDELLGAISWLPVWPLPTRMLAQPIRAAEVADVLVERADGDPAGRHPDVGGPEVLSVGEIAQSYRQVRKRRRPIVRVPIPSGFVRAFRDGTATCPDRTVGTVTWHEWLDSRYGAGQSGSANGTTSGGTANR